MHTLLAAAPAINTHDIPQGLLGGLVVYAVVIGVLWFLSKLLGG
jgi:hypothetical protein